MAHRALWTTMSDDRTWIDNPRGRRKKRGKGRKRRRGRFVKGSAAAKRYMASIRPNKGKRRRRKRRARTNLGTTAAWTVNRKRSSMARRKRGRRRYRRNPGGLFGGRSGGMIGRLQRGVQDALWVTLGEAGAGAVPALFPAIPADGIMGIVVQGATAVALGEVTARFLKNRDAARFVVAGALSKPVKGIIQQANIPLLSKALASYPLSAYPEPRYLRGIPGAMVESGEAEYAGGV